MKRRALWIIVTVTVCAVAIVGAFLAGRSIHSPNEAAIANAEEEPVISAAVEEKTVNLEQVTVSGTVALGTSWNVTPASTEGATPVVTGVTASAGGTLSTGGMLATVSGSPVIALQLPFDLYRDISGGMSGDDVVEIQRALQNLGLYAGAIDGDYGSGTARGVEKLYKAVGAAPPSPDAQAVTDLAAAKTALTAAQKAASAAPDDQSAAAAVTAAQTDVNQKTVAALTPVKMAEIITLPASSVSVVSVAAVNTKVSDSVPLAQLRSGAASATARISVADKELFAQGATVSIQSASDMNVTSTGTVSALSAFQQADPDNGKDVPGYDITVEVGDPSVFGDGQSVNVIAGQGRQASGLAVPVTALRQDGDDTYVVRTETGEHVPVTVTVTSDGYALVENTGLVAGDTVIVLQS